MLLLPRPAAARPARVLRDPEGEGLDARAFFRRDEDAREGEGEVPRVDDGLEDEEGLEDACCFVDGESCRARL